jgi:hypothetical protein
MVQYFHHLCIHAINLCNLFISLHLSECNQPQDDQHNVNVNIHNVPNDSLVQDVPCISHHQHDSADTPPPDSDDFDPESLDEYEQQDAVLQAEWQAHAVAIQALT